MHTVPSKYGKPGDTLLMTPTGLLSTPVNELPDTLIDARGRWSCGLLLAPEDVLAVERVLVAAFEAAFPMVAGTLILPIRPNRDGELHLYANTTRKPVLVDLDGDPVASLDAGVSVRFYTRLCPWVRDGRQGVSVYLNSIERVADPASVPADTLIHPMARRSVSPKAVPVLNRTARSI